MTNYNERKIEERFHSISVPGDMYFLQPEVAVEKVHGVETLLQKEQNLEKMREACGGLKGVANLEDVSSETAKSSNTLSEGQKRRGPGIS